MQAIYFIVQERAWLPAARTTGSFTLPHTISYFLLGWEDV